MCRANRESLTVLTGRLPDRSLASAAVGRRAGRFGKVLTSGWMWVAIFTLVSCADQPQGPAPAGSQEAAVGVKTAAVERAQRRLFDGAPPVIPHSPFGAPCVSCHHERGMAVEGLGFSPPSPHELTQGMSAISRCEQCHVFQRSQQPWVETTFVGQPQDLRRGTRLYPGAPPTMPHAKLMRENCRACHSGAAAREEIRTSHPERQRCEQCHVEQAVEPPVMESFPT